jgi:cystathionine beta-lyase/cystathionine gamma-synthase
MHAVSMARDTFMNEKQVKDNIETTVIHAGEARPRIHGAVVTPIFQSSTYEYTGQTDYHDVPYARLNNSPNHRVLNEKIAAIEGAEAAIVAGSGMAAISTALFTVLKEGDHLLAIDCLYGGTHGLVTKDLPRFGISHTLVSGEDPSAWKRELRPNTRAFYAETLTNPLLQMPDVAGIARFAREHDLISLIDNTFASPINFRPASVGFTITLESCTKYLNGHNDLTAGAASGNAAIVDAIKRKLDHFGGTLDPHAAYLLNRGLKTLAVRVRHQNESANRIAAFLSEYSAVSKVNYPGLLMHARHARAKELLSGFGGMMSFEFAGGLEAAERFLKRLRIPTVAASLGGVESLIIRPAAAIHSNLSAHERAKSGISDGLIRFSVGLENADDLIADLEQALRGTQ